MFWENFKKLCELRNETPNSVCKALGFSNATSTHWKYGASPKGKTLIKIADYFGVSVDRLLGDGSSTVNKKPPEIISNADIISDGKNIYMIPLFENVSAGFGAYAVDHITDYIPMYFSNLAEPNCTSSKVKRGSFLFFI